MSLIAEILKAGATKATSVVVDAQTRITLGVGDLLKLPQGDNVQTLRQGNDLVVVIDNGDGLPPDRVVVQGFFAQGSLGMVQIGADGAADMVTPRSEVAQFFATPVATPNTSRTEALVTTDEQDGGRVHAQVFEDLGVNDSQGALFAAQEDAAQTPSLVSLLDGLGVEEQRLPLAGVSEFDFSFSRSVAILEAPVFQVAGYGDWVNGAWINRAAMERGYTVGGQGIDGMLVEVQFGGSSGKKVQYRTPVVGGQWSVKLSGDDIAALGEGGVALAAIHTSQLGQAFSVPSTGSLRIDTLPPEVPTMQASEAITIDGVLTAKDVAGNPLTVTVRAEPGSKLKLTLTDTPANVVTLEGSADAEGRYVFDIKPELTRLQENGQFSLKDGLIIYKVEATDAAGNTRSSIEPNFNLRQTIPSQPLVRLAAADDTGGSPSDGITSDTTPTFSGSLLDTDTNTTKIRVYRDARRGGENGVFDGIPSVDELVATVTLVGRSFTFTPNLSAEATDLLGKKFQYLFVAEDDFGNQASAVAVPITLDTVVGAPTLDVVAKDDRVNYNEILAETVRFSGTADPFASVTLTFRSGDTRFEVLPITADAAGRWIMEVPSNVRQPAQRAQSLRYGFGEGFKGNVDVSVQQTDLAGNVSSPVVRSIYVRAQPVDQVSSLSILAEDDTGISSTDGITKLSQFRLTGVGPASDIGQNNMVVRVYCDVNNNGVVEDTDTLLGEIRTDAGGGFTGKVPAEGVLADGRYQLITVVYDELSGGTSALTGIKQRLNIVVDTQVSNVTFDTVTENNIVTLDELASGFITLTGTAEPLAKVSLVFRAGTAEISNYNNVSVDGVGKWSVQVTRADFVALGSGSVTLRATQTDVAGNTTSLTNSLEREFQIRLGTLETPTNLRLLATDDTGSSGSDGITSKGTGLTLTGNAEPGYIIKLFNDHDNDGVLDAGEQIATPVTVGTDGSFNIVVDLAQGTHNLRVQAFDEAGQSSGATAPYTVWVDQNASAPVVLKVTSDRIINFREALNNAANFSGEAESQASVQLRFFRDGNLVHDKSLTSGVDGAWSLNLTGAEVQALQAGATAVSQWTVQSRQTDKAGNTSVWSELSFHIDTAAPSSTSTANNAAAAEYNNDPARAWRDASGTSPVLWSEVYGFNLGLTEPKTLQVAVGLMSDVLVNHTVKMAWGGQIVLHTVTAEDVARGYALVGITGDRIERNRTNTASDFVDVRASFIDTAGNESALVDVISNMQVTLAGVPPSLMPQSDAYNTLDGATSTYFTAKSRDSLDVNGRVFTIRGQAAAFERLVIFNDTNMDGIAQSSEAIFMWDPVTQLPVIAEVTAGQTGSYKLDLSLLPGTYYLRAIPVASPNPSPSEVVRVVVDAVPPAPPVLSTSVLSGGFISAVERDNVNNSGLVLSGTGEPGATINVQLLNLTTGVNGTIYRNAKVRDNGTWDTRVEVVQWGQVGDGVISVKVSQTDRAGNTSEVFTVGPEDAKEPPRVVFDTVVAAPTVLQVTTDDILNAAESQTGQTFRGTGEVGATVAVTFIGSNGSVGPVNATVNDQGFWEYTLLGTQITTTLGDGLLAINVAQTDRAGNVSLVSSRVVTIDTQANRPQIATVAEDNAIHAGERDKGVEVTGSAELQAVVQVRVTGSNGTIVNKSTNADETGTWRVALSPAEINRLGQGTASVEARQTDKAGNLSDWSLVRSVTVATAPLTPGVSVKDVTGDNQILVSEQGSTVLLEGGGPPNTTLHLQLIGQRGTLSMVRSVNAQGEWSADLTTDIMQNTLGPGSVTVKANAVNAMQQSTSVFSHKFTIELQVPSPTFSRVASDNYVNANEASAPLIIDGGGVIGNVVEVTLSGQGSTFTRSALVNAERKWSITLSVGEMALLRNGEVNVSAVQKASSAPNAATSIVATNRFIIDTVAPSTSNVTDVRSALDYNRYQSEVAGGVTVTEASDGVVVALALPADAVVGDRFTLRWGEQEITQIITAAMVPSVGSRVVYVQVPAGTLITEGDGTINITAVFSDVAGNVSESISVVSSVVVRAPPSAPSVNTVYSDGYINAQEFTAITANSTAEIKGNAPDGGTIRVTLTNERSESIVLPTINVAGGAWTVTPSATQLLALGEGRIFVRAVYTNSNGANSMPSDAEFVFDKTVPLVPEAGSANALAAAEANARSVLAGGLVRNVDGLTEEARKTEAAFPVVVNVALAKSDDGVNDVKSGDTLTLLWGSTQQVNAIVTEADLARGYAQVLVSTAVMSAEGDNNALQVKARITDKAGNVGADYLVWTGKVDAIPLTPEVNAVSVDDFLNANEAAGGWFISGQGSVGGRVVITIEGTNLDSLGNKVKIVSHDLLVVLDSSNVPRWSMPLSKAQADLLGQGRMRITSVQYDESNNASDAGRNPSDLSIREFTIDTIKPKNPTIKVISGNDRVSFTEGQSSIPIAGTGESGATVSVTISHETATPITKSETVVDGKWTVTLTPAELNALGGGSTPLVVSAIVIDPADNKSEVVTRSFLYSTDEMAKPTFTQVTGIVPVADLAFNLADFQALSAGNPFTVRGTATASAPGEFNTVRLLAKTEGGATFTYILDVDTRGNWFKEFNFASSEFNALGQGKVFLSAALINSSGDESMEQQFSTGNSDNSFLIDTVPPSLPAATVSASGRDGNAKAGDVITVMVQASESLTLTGVNLALRPTVQLNFGNGVTRSAVYNAALTTAAGSDKLVFTYVVQNGDSAVTVQPSNSITLNGAVLADAADNPSANMIAIVPGRILRVDTVTPVALDIVSVDAAANGTPGQVGANNKINFAEAAMGVKVRVSLTNGTVLDGTRAQDGDTVELAWQVGTTVSTITKLLTAQDVSAGFVDVTVNASIVGVMDGSANLVVRLVDVAGNTSPSSAQQVVLVDTVKPESLSIEAWLDDNKVSKSEADNSGLNMMLRGAALEPGGTITAVLTQGVSSFNLATVSGGSPGTWMVSSQDMRNIVNSLSDGDFTVKLFQTDAAGNVSLSTTGNYFIDRNIPGRPVITGIPASTDGWVNLRDAQTVGVTVVVSLVNTNTLAGDTVVIGGFTNEFSHTVTANELAVGFANVVLPASAVLQDDPDAPPSLSRAISARIEDKGGNVSPLSDAVLVNVDTIINSPKVNTTQGAANGISKHQAKAPVDFFGSGVEEGAQVSVYFTGVLGSTLLSTTIGQAGGLYKVTLQPNDMLTLGDGVVNYRVVQTDVALNTSDDTVGSFDLRLSTPLPTLLNVTEDNVVNVNEAGNIATEPNPNRTAVAYEGLGLRGALVKLNFYVRDDEGVYKTDPEIAQKTASVGDNGFWKVNLSVADLANLSKRDQGTVLILATQTEFPGVPELEAESGVVGLEFYLDRKQPALLTAKNLFSYSEGFDNAVWGKNAAVIAYDVATAPDGSQTAEALVPNSGSVRPFVNQVSTVTAGQTYTYSIYLKNGTLNQPWVEVSLTGDATRRAWFNTSDGTFSTTPRSGETAFTSASMTKVDGTDWYRASVTFTSALTTTNIFWALTVPGSGSIANITGDGLKPSVLLWGAQLEHGTAATAYQKIDALPALSLFDGNGDGANNDGLLVTFAEPVAVDFLTKEQAYKPTSGSRLGSDFRMEAVDSASINGQFYATKFRLFLGADNTLVQGQTITINRNSIMDAGGNLAARDQVLTIPSLSVPGLPTPPVDIMSDNRINLEEATNVTRLSFTDTNTPGQLSAARGGLLQVAVNGVVVDETQPRANFLIMDLTLNKEARLLQGQAASASLRVTFLDGSSRDITLWTTGTSYTQATGTSRYRFTSKEATDLSNVVSMAYNNDMNRNAFLVPETFDPTGLTSSGLKITSTGTYSTTPANNTLQTTVSLNLKFGNDVFLGSGKQSSAKVYVYFTDLNEWQIVDVVSAPRSAELASTPFRELAYTFTTNRPMNGPNNYFWDTVPSNVSLDPAITVLTSGANAPVITSQFESSVVVKTDTFVKGSTLTTRLLDQNLNQIVGTEDTLQYSVSNPNRVLYTQSVPDALSAAGRKLQMFVDGKPVGAPTTMGISEITLRHRVNWENQFGQNSNWPYLSTVTHSLQAGAQVTASLIVNFKPVLGTTPPPVEVVVTAVGGSLVNVSELVFRGAFVNAATGVPIDAAAVASVVYKANSISQNFPNEVLRGTAIETSQWVNLPASVWAGETEGLKQLTAQTTTADGSLSSVFSAPKQIRLDLKVGGIRDVSLVQKGNTNTDLENLQPGDVLEIRFTENVAFTFSALPASFGVNPIVRPIASENGFAQVWQVTLGTPASGVSLIQAGQQFTMEARKVFDQAGNDNGSGSTPTVFTLPATLMSQAGLPIIDNVSDDNVISDTAAATPVKVNLTKAQAGDVVKLLMDGVEVGSQTVTTNGQADISFQVNGSQWGADGERTLTTNITRGGMTMTSAARSVYVAADTTHWSQEAQYAGKIHWFDPDAIVQADGTVVQTWKASAGGLTVATSGTGVTKIVDVLTGRAYLASTDDTVFLETKVNNAYYLYEPATMARNATDTSIAGAGYTSLSMFKPTVQGSVTVMQVPIYQFTGNSTPVSYVTGNVPGGPVTTVAPYTRWLGSQNMQYFFSSGNSTTRLHNHWAWWGDMTNVISVGSWQMVTMSVNNTRLDAFNQMRFNLTELSSGFIPDATTTLASVDYRNQSVDSAIRRFRIGGGTGIIGDQINVTVATGWAYEQEVGAYLGAKHQSTGSVVARNDNPSNNTYDLAVSNVAGTLIDQRLILIDKDSNDTVITAGADYVNTGAGNDVVNIKDWAFRHIDAGLGNDTLKLAPGFTGRSVVTLADFASNYRGMSGTTEDNKRVNAAGYHRLLGIEKIDLVQLGETEDRRQVVTVSVNDVRALSETNVLEMRLGKEDVVLATGFVDNFGVRGVYRYNDSWYDRKFSQVLDDQNYDLYTNSGDRMPEVVSFKTLAAINQVQIIFDHAMTGGAMLGGNFSIQTFTGPQLDMKSATSVNLRQGVALTLSGPLNVAAKITYNGDITDEAGRGFRHKIWLLGTNGGDTLNGATLSPTEQARGVTFIGGNSVDYITGTSGEDLIIGGLGGDILTGGLGSDTFLYRNEIIGSGAAGSLGGTSGDTITDFTFNHANAANNDSIDLSSLFETNFKATGDAAADATALINGGFLELRKVINFQTGMQDLQIWVDRDGASSGGGGSLYGQLVTIADGGSNLPKQYPAVESNETFLTRLLEEGRLVVSSF